MKEINIEEIVKRIEEAERASRDGFPIALLCGEAVSGMLASRLSQKTDAEIVILDPAAEKHSLKRKLNEIGSEMILFTEEFEPMVYEIMNDGSTLLHETLNVESCL